MTLTDEERNKIRWYFDAHASDPSAGYASAGTSNIESLVVRKVGAAEEVLNRVRVVIDTHAGTDSEVWRDLVNAMAAQTGWMTE